MVFIWNGVVKKKKKEEERECRIFFIFLKNDILFLWHAIHYYIGTSKR